MKNRTLLKYHSYLGVFAGIFLLVLGITGSILVFTKDIDKAIFSKYTVKSEIPDLQLDKAIEEVQKEFPKWNTRIVHFKKGETILFNIRSPEDRKYVFVNPNTGKITHVISATRHFTKWILKLHYSLHAGILGRFIILFTGIAFLLSLITGIILYRKVIVKTLFFQVKINKSNKRNYYSILHRYIGVWALILNLLLAVTGIFLAYKVSTSALKKESKPNSPAITISIEKSLKIIENKYPEFSPSYIRLPTKDNGSIIINGIFKGDAFYLSEYYNKIKIDGSTGEITEVIKISKESLLTKLSSSILPLHFGQYGGIWSKVIYCLIGLSGPFLSITGYFLWLKAKARKKK